MAIAQAHLAAVYNKDGFNLINNYTYGTQLVRYQTYNLLSHVLQSLLEMVVSWKVWRAKLPVLEVTFNSVI